MTNESLGATFGAMFLLLSTALATTACATGADDEMGSKLGDGSGCSGEDCCPDCLGTQCAPEDGKVVVVEGEGPPTRVTVETSNVLWIDGAGRDSRVMKTSLTGGATKVIAQGQDNAVDLVAGSNEMFWLNSDVGELGGKAAVMRAGIDEGVPLAVASGFSAPLALVLEGDDIFFIADQGVMKVSRGGGAITTIAEPQLGTLLQPGIAVMGPSVYWTNVGQSMGSGFIARAAIAGELQSATMVATSPRVPTAIHTDLTHIYWADEGADDGPGAVLRFPLAGGNTRVLVDASMVGSWTVGAIAIDVSHVFWIDGEGAIYKTPKDGGADPVLVATAEPDSDLDVSGNCLYWTEADGGRVMRVSTREAE